MFCLICVCINGGVNNRAAGDLRRYRAHYDVILIWSAWLGASVKLLWWKGSNPKQYLVKDRGNRVPSSNINTLKKKTRELSWNQVIGGHDKTIPTNLLTDILALINPNFDCNQLWIRVGSGNGLALIRQQAMILLRLHYMSHLTQWALYQTSTTLWSRHLQRHFNGIWSLHLHSNVNKLFFCLGPILHMVMLSNGNIFRVTNHLCGEFIGPRWLPRTKASDTELWGFFFICAWIHGWVNWWFETPSSPLWCHCNKYLRIDSGNGCINDGPVYNARMHHQ